MYLILSLFETNDTQEYLLFIEISNMIRENKFHKTRALK